MQQIKLIALYYYVCGCYDRELRWYCQRFSNNSKQEITDEEILTIFLYALMYEHKCHISSVYDYAQRYMPGWFPRLPSYPTFVTRLNRLAPTLPHLAAMLLQDVGRQGVDFGFSVLDSFPVMLCSGRRRGKVAREFVDKGYCATKGVHYWGIKLHTLSFHRPGKLPLPEYLHITPASENDLTAMRQVLGSLLDRTVFADKAYVDQALNAAMADNRSEILTPVKLVKGEGQLLRQFNKAAADLFSTAVSRIRQPIESFFNWLNELFKLQNASKVRSHNGLIVHTFGKIAAALALWAFNP